MDPEPLLTPYEMKLADARAVAAGTESIELMRRAGALVASAASRMISPGAGILVVAGPGQNGGDGFVAARILAEQGHAVTVGFLGERERLTGDAAQVAAAWDGPVVNADAASFEDCDLIIDALFGAGLVRDIGERAYRLVNRINAANRPILAVDLPSGIDGETGAVRGIAVRATRTITFVTRKPGHLLMPGRAHCGPVEVGDIGIGDADPRNPTGADLRQSAAVVASDFPSARGLVAQIRPGPCARSLGRRHPHGRGAHGGQGRAAHRGRARDPRLSA